MFKLAFIFLALSFLRLRKFLYTRMLGQMNYKGATTKPVSHACLPEA